MKPDLRPPADGCHRLRLGEDLGIGADPDLQILRPHIGFDQRLLDLPGLRRPGFHRCQAASQNVDTARADRLGLRGVSLGLFLDHPLDDRLREGHAAGLDRLQIDRGQHMRPAGITAMVHAVVGDALDRAKRYTAYSRERIRPDRHVPAGPAWSACRRW